MYNECCVVSCNSRRKDVAFYSFPKTEIDYKKWLESINCDWLSSLSNIDLHKNFVCRKHFEKRFLTSAPVRSRLHVGAYPTLFTENEIVSGIPETTRIKINKSRSPHHEKNHFKKRRHEDHTYNKCEDSDKDSWEEKKQVLFIEGALEADLIYDKHKDRIDGFADQKLFC